MHCLQQGLASTQNTDGVSVRHGKYETGLEEEQLDFPGTLSVVSEWGVSYSLNSPHKEACEYKFLMERLTAQKVLINSDYVSKFV